MLFNSIGFAVFCPVVIIIYFVLEKKPQRHKAACIWLLISSYFYYMCADVRYGLLLLGVTAITWLCGMVCGNEVYIIKKRRLALIIGIGVNLSLLFFFKYFNLVSDLIKADPAMKIVLPVGVSFYVFSSLTYVFDTYKGKQKVEKNFLKYALFVSFFPVLLAGPIERSVNLLPQFDELHHFDYERIRKGLIKMAYGYFLKIVIAQRLAITVDMIYGNVWDVNGFQLLLATVLYAFQIYCDFASYSSIAVGIASIMGFKLTENFKQPFLARSCAELWRRWHISLNNWFINYVYIPMGGSRKGRARKYINIMTVFTLSGIWHGAALHYILWGMLSGLFQVMGDLLKGPKERIISKLPVHNSFTSKCHSIIKVVITFLLFVTALVFFRSDSTVMALTVFSKIFTGMRLSDIAATSVFELGLGVFNLLYLIAGMALMIIYDVINEKTGDATAFIAGQNAVKRWIIYYAAVIMIIGSASIGAKQFIYFAF